MNWKLILQVIVISLTVVGCNKAPEQVTTQHASSQPVQVDMSTPDKAIKSYWSVRDAVRKSQDDIFRRSIESYRNASAQFEDVLTGELAKAWSTKPSSFETFERDILDVKIETESRAIVTAVIRNTSPIPAGADVSRFVEQRRLAGERYRYVLEKTGSAWKVSEIWFWDEYVKRDWSKKYPRDGKPLVSFLTIEGI